MPKVTSHLGKKCLREGVAVARYALSATSSISVLTPNPVPPFVT